MNTVKRFSLSGVLVAFVAALLLFGSLLLATTQNAYAEEIDTAASYTNVKNADGSLAIHQNGSFFAEAACIESTLDFPTADGTPADYKNQGNVDTAINNGKTLSKFDEIKKVIYIYSQTNELSAYTKRQQYEAAWAAVAHFACEELPTYAADYSVDPTGGTAPKDASAWSARPAYDYLLAKAESSDVVVPDGLELAFFQDPTSTPSGGHKTQTLVALKLFGTSSGGGDTKYDVNISKVAVNGTEELPGAQLEITSTASGFETISWTSTNEQKKVQLAPGTYTLTEKTAPDGYEVAESIEFVVTAEGKVTVGGTDVNGVVKMEDAPTSERNGDIGTTVAVNNKTAAANTVLNMDFGASVSVVDTVAYTDLIAGKTYEVTGRLMQITADEEKEIATKTISGEATSASGTWTVDFGTVALKDDSYYVVYETATCAEDDQSPYEHEDSEDLAQAINVGKGWEKTNLFEKTPNFTPVFENQTTPKIISTTVDIDGKAATSTSARVVEAAYVAQVKHVNDTIKYEGFSEGETYKVVSKLMLVGTTPTATATSANTSSASSASSSASSTTTATSTATYTSASPTEVAKAEKDGLKADGDTWKVTIDTTLEQGKRYVVYEYVYDSEGNLIASHEDPNDKAQTIETRASATANNVTGATQTAKTADTATGVALLAALVAAGSAALLLGARRKSHN